LNATEKDIADYISALNAHAIVAITNQKGVIVQVNDRFCEISQYSRDELCGNTHKLINSGYHPPRFFKEFWNTITHGRIWQGEVCNRAKDGSIYWVYSTIVPFVGDDGKPEKYIAIRADITKLKHVEQEAQRLSRQDDLTGLFNRRMFAERFLEAQRDSALNGQFCALLSIDLDGFKGFNDHFGHGHGDKLLIELARRLAECTRKRDTVARMGGDEFLMILTDLGDNADTAIENAAKIGKRILKAMAAPYFLPDSAHSTSRKQSRLSISGSIGGRIFFGNHITMDELLVQVDQALYQAKNNGKNQLVFYETDRAQHEAIRKNIALEISLRSALERGEMYMQYQPIVDAQQNILGMEALSRWHSAEHGLISPAQFIPLAERAGLIGSIGMWALETGCKQLAAWTQDAEKAAWTLSVNVSALQFNAPSFFDDVLNILSRTHIPPHKLILEVTENIFLNAQGSPLQEGIRRLMAHGVGIALDDFGTGYSSMNYLRNLPITRIKIDRTFISEVAHSKKDQGIVSAMLTLASALDLQVVAEGVETTAQFDYLKDAGCSAFQGYLFAKPQDISAFTS